MADLVTTAGVASISAGAGAANIEAGVATTIMGAAYGMVNLSVVRPRASDLLGRASKGDWAPTKIISLVPLTLSLHLWLPASS